MITQTLIIEKIKKIEKILKELNEPKPVLGKIQIDSETLKKAKKALFDFDIEKFVSKKDLKLWKPLS